MDRWEFRRRNVIGDGDLGATGQVFEGDVLGPMLERMEALRAQRPEPAADGRLLGTAVAVGTLVHLRRPVGRDGQPQPRRQRDPHHRGRGDRLRLARPGAAADRRRPARDAPGGRRRPRGGHGRRRLRHGRRRRAHDRLARLGERAGGRRGAPQAPRRRRRHARGVAGGPRAGGRARERRGRAGQPASRVLEVIAHANAASGPISGTGLVHRARHRGDARLRRGPHDRGARPAGLRRPRVRRRRRSRTPVTSRSSTTASCRTWAARSTRARSTGRSRAGSCRAWATRCTRS